MTILKDTVEKILTKGKGILAADETPQNIGSKFATCGIDNTPETRQKYREMLFSTMGMEEYISGVILHDETFHQRHSQGMRFVDFLTQKNVIPGIKVDMGLIPYGQAGIEKQTQGLDGLDDRLAHYFDGGARFAKWRAVITIDGQDYPSKDAIDVNMDLLAQYAKACQKNNIVPIVEPEVLMDGPHTQDRCDQVTRQTLSTLFNALKNYDVNLSTTLLKPNMIVAGQKCDNQPTPMDVALRTIDCLLATVPTDVPGIVFLSGGQSDQDAAEHLNLMIKSGKTLPWVLTYSYGRALHLSAIHAWSGKEDHWTKGQKTFLHRAHMNSLASQGKYVRQDDAA